jgi:hypothetical protein
MSRLCTVCLYRYQLLAHRNICKIVKSIKQRQHSEGALLLYSLLLLNYANKQPATACVVFH